MGKDERIAAVDFLVSVLKEHEKSLDRLVEKLEKLVSGLKGLGGYETEGPDGVVIRVSGGWIKVSIRRGLIHVEPFEEG